ncbi:hypothetical protein B0H16DRAFT_1397218, partial [Mycena metata]
MGVPGLWKELEPAAKVRSLTNLAVVDGFEENRSGSRGFCIGVDASIWFFHATYRSEGKNPELQMMFFRCARLMRAPFLPLFVFDGPRRPNVKRGKEINTDLHPLTPGMKEIVESFGFEWRVAPGEAEAELAYLNRIGVLDGVLSDDVDTFLFGATTVIRNPSNNLSGSRANPALNSEGGEDKDHTHVYRIEDIMADVSFTRGDMILIGLCSGGDYDTSGMPGCGPGIAKALVRYGFGRSLYEAAKNLPRDALPAFLHHWRNKVGHELRTDSEGHIGSKRHALADAMTRTDAFPDIDILLSYINPLTSESTGRASDNLELTWSREPDLGKLATTCEKYFGWDRDTIIKRFETNVWPGVVLRILRRGLLDAEGRWGGVPSTPTKNGRPGLEGTPSKKHFSSMSFNPVEDDDDDRLITKITRTREHTSTDGILEYRLEIRPRQLVLLAESGIKNIRRPLEEDVWAGLTELGNEGGAEKVEEEKVLVWMPASMVRMAEPRLVEEFEEIKRLKEEAKRLKKAEKGLKRPLTKRKPNAKAAAAEEEFLDAPETPKKAVRKAKAPILEVEESDSDALPPKRRPTKAKTILRAPPLCSHDDELLTFQLPTKPPAIDKDMPPAPMTDPFLASNPRPRVVRDLTKGKGKAVSALQLDAVVERYTLSAPTFRRRGAGSSAPTPPFEESGDDMR